MSSRMNGFKERFGHGASDQMDLLSAPRVDALMRAAIHSSLQQPSYARRGGDNLLAALVDESIRRPRTSPAAFARAQSAELIGAWFCEVDALLPGSNSALHQMFDALRVPTLKLALTERRILLDAEHPLRGLLDDALDIATQTALAESGSRELIEAQVQSRLSRLLDLAERCQPMLERLTPLSEREAARFLEQIRDRSALRLEQLQQRARRVAAQELETQILGMPLPAPALRVLRQGWVPMMATLLLRDGIGAPAVSSSLSLLPRILDGMSRRDRQGSEQAASLVPALRSALIDAGQPRAPVERLLTDLQAALETSPLHRQLSP